jgi:hypothetical protein
MGAVLTLRCSKVHTLQSGSWTPGYTSTRILANLTRTCSEPPAPAGAHTLRRACRTAGETSPTHTSTHLKSAREAAADLSLVRRPGPQRRRDGGRSVPIIEPQRRVSTSSALATSGTRCQSEPGSRREASLHEPQQKRSLVASLRELLQERGWIEGQTLVVELRYAGGKGVNPPQAGCAQWREGPTDGTCEEQSSGPRSNWSSGSSPVD